MAVAVQGLERASAESDGAFTEPVFCAAYNFPAACVRLEDVKLRQGLTPDDLVRQPRSSEVADVDAAREGAAIIFTTQQPEHMVAVSLELAWSSGYHEVQAWAVESSDNGVDYVSTNAQIAASAGCVLVRFQGRTSSHWRLRLITPQRAGPWYHRVTWYRQQTANEVTPRVEGMLQTVVELQQQQLHLLRTVHHNQLV
jgi:hypothetical protein